MQSEMGVGGYDEDRRGVQRQDRPRHTLQRLVPHDSAYFRESACLNTYYLEGEGLVERTSYESMPPCVEYSLTPLAQNFLREISYIVEWGQLHFEEIQSNRQQRKLQS